MLRGAILKWFFAQKLDICSEWTQKKSIRISARLKLQPSGNPSCKQPLRKISNSATAFDSWGPYWNQVLGHLTGIWQPQNSIGTANLAWSPEPPIFRHQPPCWNYSSTLEERWRSSLAVLPMWLGGFGSSCWWQWEPRKLLYSGGRTDELGPAFRDGGRILGQRGTDFLWSALIA